MAPQIDKATDNRYIYWFFGEHFTTNQQICIALNRENGKNYFCVAWISKGEFYLNRLANLLIDLILFLGVHADIPSSLMHMFQG